MGEGMKTALQEDVERVDRALRSLGSPKDVLPACLWILMANAKSAGATPESFIAAIMPTVLLIWDEKEVDPRKIGEAIVKIALKAP